MTAAPDEDWSDYYATQVGRPPRPLLLTALNHWHDHDPVNLHAIDLGCGDGTETLTLLRSGWAVLAIDAQPAAIATLHQLIDPDLQPRLTTLVADFTSLTLPAADLIYCGWSLPHCTRNHFEQLWGTLRSALRPRGRFAGQLLGANDDWATGTAAAFTRTDIDRLLENLHVELLNEVEEDRTSYDGPKHWHYFTVIAQQPEHPPVKPNT